MNSRPFYHALEGMRGLAALLVATFHATYGWPGYLGVEFFILLSGFVLAHTVLDRPRRPSDGQFILRRFFRLYPMHLLGLLAFTLAYFFHTHKLPYFDDGTLFTLLQQLTLLHNVGFNPRGLTWNFPAWTVSVEFWINILVLVALPRQIRTATLLLLALTTYLLIFNFSHRINVHHELYWGWLASGMLRGFASFVLGWFIYRLSQRQVFSARSRWQSELFEWSPLVLLLPIFLLRIEDGPFDFVAIGLIALLTLALAGERGTLSRLLALPPLQYLGRISYCLFLLHIPVLEVFYGLEWHAGTLPAAVFLTAFVLALIVASGLAYHFIEAPCRRYFKARL